MLGLGHSTLWVAGQNLGLHTPDTRPHDPWGQTCPWLKITALGKEKQMWIYTLISHFFFWLSICPFIHPSIHPSLYPSLPIYPSIHLYFLTFTCINTLDIPGEDTEVVLTLAAAWCLWHGGTLTDRTSPLLLGAGFQPAAVRVCSVSTFIHMSLFLVQVYLWVDPRNGVAGSRVNTSPA